MYCLSPSYFYSPTPSIGQKQILHLISIITTKSSRFNYTTFTTSTHFWHDTTLKSYHQFSIFCIISFTNNPFIIHLHPISNRIHWKTNELLIRRRWKLRLRPRACGKWRFRGFGFVSFVSADSCVKALESLNGGEVDGRVVKVERARRNTGYDKTPGQCTFIYYSASMLLTWPYNF